MRVDTSTLVALRLQLFGQPDMAAPALVPFVPTAADWEFYKQRIIRLYVEDKWELRRISEGMEESFGMKAT